MTVNASVALVAQDVKASDRDPGGLAVAREPFRQALRTDRPPQFVAGIGFALKRLPPRNGLLPAAHELHFRFVQTSVRTGVQARRRVYVRRP